MARKPLIGTVAANHAAHGTGALNIDGCRIPGAKPDTTRGAGGRNGRYSPIKAEGRIVDDGRGRWPANVVLDEAAARLLDEQSGERKAGVAVRSRSGGKTFGGDSAKPPMGDLGYGDSGGASRFFYTAKASRSEREAGLREAGLREAVVGTLQGGGEGAVDPVSKRFTKQARNTHPTVKPVDLIRWKVRLVTPAGGLVLDPFAGSGTTGIAANEEGCRALLIEREAAYVEIARARNKAWAAQAVLPLAGGA